MCEPLSKQSHFWVIYPREMFAHDQKAPTRPSPVAFIETRELI